MKKHITLATLFSFLIFTTALAQHQHHMEGMNMGDMQHIDTASHHHHMHHMEGMNMGGMQHTDTSNHNMQQMEGMDMGDMHNDTAMHHHMHMMHSMSSAYSLNLPMTRNGSGTSWLPDATPMYGYMLHSGKWMFMFHGDIFIRYDNQDFTGKGSRGAEKWDAPDMLMAMGQRQLGKHGLFHFNTMFSTDALIAGGSGYPLLFQTGESWHDVPLVDRQHPHDLFSELSVSYAYSFSKKADAFLYVGYPGEPALGPVTFMHRPSGMFDPDAPIGHHWSDATHITFGVSTLGIRYGKFKLEGSLFTGREPDENRYDFDQPKFDSRSARLSFNPDEHWSMQVSQGFIKSPEALHPDENLFRNTASATYVYSFSNGKYIAATALWGQNKIAGEDASNSVLVEATLNLKRAVVYTRYEWVAKSGEELNLPAALYNEQELHALNTATLGASYNLLQIGHINTALGAQISLYQADKPLQSLYGSYPLGGEIYLHIYPGRMKM
jgi:hypothetical protein